MTGVNERLGIAGLNDSKVSRAVSTYNRADAPLHPSLTIRQRFGPTEERPEPATAAPHEDSCQPIRLDGLCADRDPGLSNKPRDVARDGSAAFPRT